MGNIPEPPPIIFNDSSNYDVECNIWQRWQEGLEWKYRDTGNLIYRYTGKELREWFENSPHMKWYWFMPYAWVMSYQYYIISITEVT